jgi:CRISPR-associated protein Csb1
MAESLADRLLAAASPSREHTAIVITATYQPTGGAGRTVQPPTYPSDERDPNAKYLMSPRLVKDEQQQAGQRRTVVIDQAPSQANRVEEALRDAHDDGTLRIPMFELHADGIRLTSLDFPHRYADAYIRDSLVEGVRFDHSEIGKRLRSATAGDVRPLYEREPCSLLFGAWDSHRKGRWPKFARLYTAEMFGLDPVLGRRMGGRLDPVNLTGRVDDSAKAENGWQFVSEGTKAKGTKLSEIGHGHIAPNLTPGGVTVAEVRRTASISLAGLERLKFGDAPRDAATLARATLAALALAGDRLAFGRPSVWLRSGCDLATVTEKIGFERPGGATETGDLKLDELEVTPGDALDAFHELRDRAASAGIPMQEDTIILQPDVGLAAAIKFALTSGAQDG